ncbi:MAG: type VI secretion system tip protein TssI/VgrG [Planctomycetota bacterium]
MSELANQSIIFEVEGLAKNTLVVTNLAGTEGLSDLWAFSLELVSRDANLDLEKILYSPVKLGLKQGIIAGGERAVRTRWFAGILNFVEQREQGQGWTTYSALMVPKMHQATEFWRSRIFMDKNIEDLVKEVLIGDPGAALASDDFQLSLERKTGSGKEAECYPEREYVVQYEESDYTFLSRWLQHEGVFYFFDNDGEKEEVIFADSTAAYRDSREVLPYRPSTQSGSAEGGENTLYEEEVVRTFSAVFNRQPKRVILKDYNWRTPEVELSIDKPVNEEGIGIQVEYNDHYKTPEQGKKLAEVRSEEFLAREQVFMASTNCKALRPGKTFKMTEHFRSSYNTIYLVTRVEHRAEQTVDLDAGRVSSGSYSNSLSLIAAEVSYRPPRTTAWPSIKGIIHAKIDAPETEGEYAEIDDYGRYRVRFPYDGSIDKNNPNKREQGPCSRYVRMLQPYAGRDSGMHFPLLKGTDVMVSHIDGDPDRPVIVGAVPNPDTMSPVTSYNYTSNKIQTTSGNVLEFNDNPENPGVIHNDATGSEVRDERFAGAGASGGGSSSPSGGGGGVGPRPYRSKRAKGTAREPGNRRRKLSQTAIERLNAPQPQPQAERPPRKPARQPGRHQLQPGDGVGAVLPEGTSTGDTVGKYFSGWETFVEGDAFQYLADEGVMIDSLPLSEENLKRAANKVLRKHSEFGTSPAGASSMAELMAGMGNEMVDMIATPFGLGSPSSGAVDDFFDNVTKQNYTAYGSKFSVKIGTDTAVNIGDKYTFNDVSNDVSFGTGGYSYHREDGDQFAESYTYGQDVSLSFYFGAKDSFSMSMAASHSSSMELDASESEVIKLGASNEFKLFIGGESEIGFEASYKNTMKLWVGLITNIDIYASATLSLELGATAHVKIEIVPDKFHLNLPKKTEITVQDLKVKLDETNLKLNNTSTNMMKTNIALSETKTALAKTQTELAETKTALQKTQTELSETKTALSETKTELSETTTALSKSQSLLSNDVKALVFNSTAGLTKL